MRFSTPEIASVTGGDHAGPAQLVAGASIDSRTIEPGQLFVPLHGRSDGHEWIPGALAAGAAAYLTERDPLGGTSVRVEHTGRALMELGAAARRKARTDTLVVGITGSVGKTTTKDMVRAVLASTFATHASPRSYNNEIGVPLTLLTAPEETQALVLELGARAPGDIATLCAVVQPEIGVVTRVAAVHTEGLGDIEGVARAKSELVQALPASGTAVLNADDPRVAAMAGAARAHVLMFGRTGDVRTTLLDIDDDLRPYVQIRTPEDTFEARLSARGEHQVANAAAAAAVGYVCGVPASEIARALERAELSGMRMAVTAGRGGVRVIDDSYNANPASVEAALRSLARIPARRRVAVLGRMAELGSVEGDEHLRIARLAGDLGIELVTVDAPEYGVETTAPEHVLEQLSDLGADDVVLVKGSRVTELDRIAGALRGDE